jgi:hypothetical protein
MLFYLFLFLVQVNGDNMLEPMQENRDIPPLKIDRPIQENRDIPPLKIPVQNGTGLIQTILSDPKKIRSECS